MIYRTAGPWGAGKGGDLTAAEVDGNFEELETAIAALGVGGADPIEAVNLSGTQLTFTLAGGAVAGPFTIPRAAFRFRGAWVAALAYFGNDVFSISTGGADDGIYLVRRSHVAEAVFNPAYDDGDGPLYQVMFAPVASGGGVSAVARPQVINADAALSYTPTAADEGAFVMSYAGAAFTINLPSDSAEDLPIGFKFTIQQPYQDMTFASPGGATIDAPNHLNPFGVGLWGGITHAIKQDADYWFIWGDLTPY